MAKECRGGNLLTSWTPGSRQGEIQEGEGLGIRSSLHGHAPMIDSLQQDPIHLLFPIPHKNVIKLYILQWINSLMKLQLSMLQLPSKNCAHDHMSIQRVTGQ